MVENEINVLDTDRISLSLSTVQNRIAVTMATLLSIDQLLDIELDKLKCPMDSTAHTPCGLMFYNKRFADGKEFVMKCAINVNSLPPVHFLRISISNGDNYKVEFKCNPDSNNNLHITKIIAKAINYSNYRNIDDSNYNRHHILTNFTNEFYSRCKDVYSEDIYAMEKVSEYLMELQKSIDSSKTMSDLSFESKGKSATFNISTPHMEIFKFTVTTEDSCLYCFFKINIIGIDSLILIVNTVINRVRMDSIDNECL